MAGLLVMQAGFISTAALEREVWGMEKIGINSPAFSAGTVIPAKYTCDSRDMSPPLIIGSVPAGTRSLALIMDDPDAPGGTWVHWVVWNVPPETREFPENVLPAGAKQGRNSWNRNGYGGPCPPSGTHRYVFKLYALDTTLNLSSSAGKAELERAVQGHLLASGQYMGTYAR
jgi:Raf kinase inhibitor-like YbhB/YbcL family protein